MKKEELRTLLCALCLHSGELVYMLELCHPLIEHDEEFDLLLEPVDLLSGLIFKGLLFSPLNYPLQVTFGLLLMKYVIV